MVPLQDLKPQWPADDCYHGCCNGETATTAPAVGTSSKEVVSAASAAKSMAKEAIKATTDVSSKVCDCLQILYQAEYWLGCGILISIIGLLRNEQNSTPRSGMTALACCS